MAKMSDRMDLIRRLWQDARIAWALLWEPRVPTWTKLLLPVLWVIYLLMPLDIIPDVIPILGELDDLVALMFIIRMFIQMSPPQVVQEIEERLNGKAQDVIDGTYRVVDRD